MSKFQEGDLVTILPGAIRYNHWTFDEFKKQPYLIVYDADYSAGEVQVFCNNYPETSLFLKFSEVKKYIEPLKPSAEIDIFED